MAGGRNARNSSLLKFTDQLLQKSKKVLGILNRWSKWMNPKISSIFPLIGKVPMENCPLYIFREKEKRKGLKCLRLFCRQNLRLDLIQHKFSLFHFQLRRERKICQGVMRFHFPQPLPQGNITT